MEATLAAGATISHHHGVGLLKAPWIAVWRTWSAPFEAGGAEPAMLTRPLARS